MYIRLKNLPDLESIKPELIKRQMKTLYECINEDLSVMDEAYGTDRSCFAYGGYVILVTNPQSNKEDIQSLCDTYHLNLDEYEYLDDVWKDDVHGMLWKKVLFILGGDENLLIYFPEQLTINGNAYDDTCI